MRVKNLTLALPLKSRHGSEIVKTLNLLYSKSLGLPVVRLHIDRARELLGKDIIQWTMAKNIYFTTTTANEPQTNGRAEQAIGAVKTPHSHLARCFSFPYQLVALGNKTGW